MAEITLPLDPNPVQLAMDRMIDTVTHGAVFKIHRQAGKTTLSMLRCIWEALSSRNPFPRTAYICEHRIEALRNGWDYLQRLAAPIPDVKFNQTLLTADFPSSGGRVSLYGADDPGSLRGTHHDLVILDEFERMNPSTLPEVVLPTVVQRQGKVVCIGTPLTRQDPLSALFEKVPTLAGWGRLMVKASESGLLSPTQLAAQRAIQSEAQYAREFECEPSEAMDGAIYGRLLDEMEREGRLGRFPWDPSTSVWTAWDIGRDMTAIWFLQPDGGGWTAIDFYQNAGMPLAHYIKVVKEKPYVYQQHIGPHDLAVTDYTNDQSRLDVAYSLGIDFTVAPRLSVEEGIDATRRFLPKLAIDRSACEPGVQALQNYQYEWRDVLRTFSAKPVHNWASHPSDALRYFVTGHDEDVSEDYKPKDAILAFDPFTWGRR